MRQTFGQAFLRSTERLSTMILLMTFGLFALSKGAAVLGATVLVMAFAVGLFAWWEFVNGLTGGNHSLLMGMKVLLRNNGYAYLAAAVLPTIWYVIVVTTAFKAVFP